MEKEYKMAACNIFDRKNYKTDVRFDLFYNWNLSLKSTYCLSFPPRIILQILEIMKRLCRAPEGRPARLGCDGSRGLRDIHDNHNLYRGIY